jgi:phosphate starvation-inducible protein PhoH and related proteins
MARKAKVKEVEFKTWADERDENVRQRRQKKPLTSRHRAYMQAIEDNQVVLAVGPPGSAKTALACEVAAKLFKEGKVKRIILVRPLVECDEAVGFLPGDLREKTAPFIAPLTQWLDGHFNKVELEGMWNSGVLSVVPLAFMRGMNFEDAIVLIDECQNMTARQIRMAMTRVGEGCRMVLSGDLKQSDIEHRVDDVPLLAAIKKLGRQPRIPSVALVVLTDDDVLRSELVKAIDSRLEP